MADEGFDPCECICTQEYAMRRLINLVSSRTGKLFKITWTLLHRYDDDRVVVQEHVEVFQVYSVKWKYLGGGVSNLEVDKCLFRRRGKEMKSYRVTLSQNILVPVPCLSWACWYSPAKTSCSAALCEIWQRRPFWFLFDCQWVINMEVIFAVRFPSCGNYLCQDDLIFFLFAGVTCMADCSWLRAWSHSELSDLLTRWKGVDPVNKILNIAVRSVLCVSVDSHSYW